MASRKGRGRNRAHTYHRPRAKSALQFQATHHCPECGKWAFPTRDDAEVSARQVHPGATMHFYRCLGLWHYSSWSADKQALRTEQLYIDEPEADAC
jgi:hypothetical protein